MSKNTTSGKVFRSLFNDDWKTAAKTIKNEFLEDFGFIWHLAWPQGSESSGMKWFGGHLIQCDLQLPDLAGSFQKWTQCYKK